MVPISVSLQGYSCVNAWMPRWDKPTNNGTGITPRGNCTSQPTPMSALPYSYTLRIDGSGQELPCMCPQESGPDSPRRAFFPTTASLRRRCGEASSNYYVITFSTTQSQCAGRVAFYATGHWANSLPKKLG